MGIRTLSIALLSITLSACSSFGTKHAAVVAEVSQIPNTNICFTVIDESTKSTYRRVSTQVNCSDYDNKDLIQYGGSESKVLINGSIKMMDVALGGTEVTTETKGDQVYIVKEVQRDIRLISSANGTFYLRETESCIHNTDGFMYQLKCVPPAWEKKWWQL
ncbi:hypothetical protein LMH73_010245 [Vibrio splendidus]|nr:hypothetical protein [Vibrio splendidus]MCC4882963.1 hypothetical protein [Vibrio splendidus]